MQLRLGSTPVGLAKTVHQRKRNCSTMQEGQQERELFTIYDEHMNEIGTEYRDVVHKKGKDTFARTHSPHHQPTHAHTQTNAPTHDTPPSFVPLGRSVPQVRERFDLKFSKRATNTTKGTDKGPLS